MGRYSTVQSYSDNNPNLAKAEYAKQVTDDGTKKKLKTESVGNVAGSTAGAGSGEFHSYRNSRRTELLRMERMEKDHALHLKAVALDVKAERSATAVERRTAKLRKKRQRKKQRKMDRKHYGAAAAPAGPSSVRGEDDAGADGGAAPKRRRTERDAAARSAGAPDAGNEGGGAAAAAAAAAGAAGGDGDGAEAEPAANRNVFESDGSFMALFGEVR